MTHPLGNYPAPRVDGGGQLWPPPIDHHRDGEVAEYAARLYRQITGREWPQP